MGPRKPSTVGMVLVQWVKSQSHEMPGWFQTSGMPSRSCCHPYIIPTPRWEGLCIGISTLGGGELCPAITCAHPACLTSSLPHRDLCSPSPQGIPLGWYMAGLFDWDWTGMRSWMDSLALSLVDIFPTLLHSEHLFILFIKWPQGFGWNIPGHGTSWELGQPFSWTRSIFFLVCFSALLSIVVFSLHLQTFTFFYPLLHSLLCMASLSPRPTLTCNAPSKVNPSSHLNNQEL